MKKRELRRMTHSVHKHLSQAQLHMFLPAYVSRFLDTRVCGASYLVCMSEKAILLMLRPEVRLQNPGVEVRLLTHLSSCGCWRMMTAPNSLAGDFGSASHRHTRLGRLLRIW